MASEEKLRESLRLVDELRVRSVETGHAYTSEHGGPPDQLAIITVQLNSGRGELGTRRRE